ncbi:hypothetical protein [Peribacillus frigoritolerans]|nr:hypothetical protein [Peribacillus frigoritolerans]
MKVLYSLGEHFMKYIKVGSMILDEKQTPIVMKANTISKSR